MFKDYPTPKKRPPNTSTISRTNKNNHTIINITPTGGTLFAEKGEESQYASRITHDEYPSDLYFVALSSVALVLRSFTRRRIAKEDREVVGGSTVFRSSLYASRTTKSILTANPASAGSFKNTNYMRHRKDARIAATGWIAPPNPKCQYSSHH